VLPNAHFIQLSFSWVRVPRDMKNYFRGSSMEKKNVRIRSFVLIFFLSVTDAPPPPLSLSLLYLLRHTDAV